MRNIKLLHLAANGQESLVATFQNLNEAMLCRDLLQAKTDQINAYYAVDYYDKTTKTIRRKTAESFAPQVQYMHESVRKNLRAWLS